MPLCDRAAGVTRCQYSQVVVAGKKALLAVTLAPGPPAESVYLSASVIELKVRTVRNLRGSLIKSTIAKTRHRCSPVLCCVS